MEHDHRRGVALPGAVLRHRLSPRIILTVRQRSALDVRGVLRIGDHTAGWLRADLKDVERDWRPV